MPTNVVNQCTKESALHVFQETTLDLRLEAVVETEAVSLFVAASHEDTKLLRRIYSELPLKAPSLRLYK